MPNDLIIKADEEYITSLNNSLEGGFDDDYFTVIEVIKRGIETMPEYVAKWHLILEKKKELTLLYKELDDIKFPKL